MVEKSHSFLRSILLNKILKFMYQGLAMSRCVSAMSQSAGKTAEVGRKINRKKDPDPTILQCNADVAVTNGYQVAGLQPLTNFK
jgi:hypothetical protein